MRVYVPQDQQQLVDCAKDVRVRSVQVIAVNTDLQDIPFNKGYYTVDMTFFFEVCLELFGGVGTQIVPVTGLTVFTKKVIMYGSESNVRTFYSDCGDTDLFGSCALPKVSVQVAEPIALSAKLCECCHMHHHHGCKSCFDNLSEDMFRRYGSLDMGESGKGVFVTIGLFSIVQMLRNVQMLIPAYDFCIPTKECAPTQPENPCELFSTIDFPTDAFFPPVAGEGDNNGSCGCR